MKPFRPDAATSARMAGIRQRGTKIETEVAAVLRSLNLHYRKNVKTLPGSPDFANRSRRWAIFVNGCFWHHHTGCAQATVPKTNTGFWTGKFRDNRRRDARAIRSLRRQGFKVVVIWGCQTESIALKLRGIVDCGRGGRG